MEVDACAALSEQYSMHRCMLQAAVAALLCVVKLSYGDWPMCKQAQTSKMDNDCRTRKGLMGPACLLRSARRDGAEAWKGHHQSLATSKAACAATHIQHHA